MRKLIASALVILALSTVLLADPPPSCNPGDINGPPCAESSTNQSITDTILIFLGIKK